MPEVKASSCAASFCCAPVSPFEVEPWGDVCNIGDPRLPFHFSYSTFKERLYLCVFHVPPMKMRINSSYCAGALLVVGPHFFCPYGDHGSDVMHVSSGVMRPPPSTSTRVQSVHIDTAASLGF